MWDLRVGREMHTGICWGSSTVHLYDKDIWKNKMDAGLAEIGSERVNWTDLYPDRDKYRDHVNL